MTNPYIELAVSALYRAETCSERGYTDQLLLAQVRATLAIAWELKQAREEREAEAEREEHRANVRARMER